MLNMIVFFGVVQLSLVMRSNISALIAFALLFLNSCPYRTDTPIDGTKNTPAAMSAQQRIRNYQPYHPDSMISGFVLPLILFAVKKIVLRGKLR
jgi:hypothetical protein